MKRQVAILGGTPEFLRWSIRQACPLRGGIALDSVDQTEKRLRAVRTAGLALAQDRVRQGIAVQQIQGRPKGFRVSEVLQIFGGTEGVQAHCHSCPANVASPDQGGGWAGCFGWLPRTTGPTDLALLIESSLDARQRQGISERFLVTRPAWYGFWSAGCLQGAALEWVHQLFQPLLSHPQVDPATRDFAAAMSAARQNQLTLDLELVPPGNSDGLRWVIAAHCDRCKAVVDGRQEKCQVCQKPGKGHPPIHRKVLGLRPWVDLAVVVGPDRVAEFLSAFPTDDAPAS